MMVYETPRLTLRRIVPDDAPFLFELMNDPSWLKYIGDRGIRTLEDARQNILKGPVAMYERVGFGLFLVVRKEDGLPAGICGPIKRDTLDDVDLGFAFVPRYAGLGYGFESAKATLEYAAQSLALRRIVAITVADNSRSIRLLEKLGFAYERETRLNPSAPPVRLYGRDLAAAG